MDVSPPPAPFRRRSSRRSFPNLTHLSLAPLSSHFPIDDEGYDVDQLQVQLPRSSYIQGKSAPTTPGILGRPPAHGHQSSRSRKKLYAHESYLPSDPMVARSELDSLPKAKSSSALLLNTTAIGSGNLRHVSARSAAFLGTSNEEWYHRAGLAIASGTRESKGQAWLVRRESSTSLVQQGGDDDDGDDDDQNNNIHHHQYGEAAASAASTYHHHGSFGRWPTDQFVGGGGDDDSGLPYTPGYFNHSRASSKKTSRRGSRAGSRVGFLTPMESRTPAEEYFDDVGFEPDFLEPEERTEDHADEDEIARLSRVQGFGFGGIVDRLVGLSLFNVDEDSENEEEVKEAETAEEALKNKQAQLKRRRVQMARAASSSADATGRNASVVEPPRQDEAGGWNDAAWLLSVASKVIL